MKAVVSTVFNDEQSKHMKSEIHITRHEILGLPLLEYSVRAAHCAGFEPFVIENLANLPEKEDNYIVLAGNAPLVQGSTITRLALFHEENNNDISIVSDGINDTGISSAMLAVKGLFLEEALHAVSEGRIPKSRTIMRIENAAEMFQVWDRVGLAYAYGMLRARINEFHMKNGVTIIDPARTDIGADVIIGRDTTIYHGCLFEGQTEIGSRCRIGPDCRIIKSVLADSIEVSYSNVIEASIGEATVVGPYAYIRPGSIIGAECKIGDFVEVKNSVIAAHTKASHLTYIGDSDVGQNVNFGCGTVTVNYNGKNKNRTVIGKNAFIGCNTNLVAPVNVGENAYTAAGSTITGDVPPDSLAIARAYQTNKRDWVKLNR